MIVVEVIKVKTIDTLDRLDTLDVLDDLELAPSVLPDPTTRSNGTNT